MWRVMSISFRIVWWFGVYTRSQCFSRYFSLHDFFYPYPIYFIFFFFFSVLFFSGICTMQFFLFLFLCLCCLLEYAVIGNRCQTSNISTWDRRLLFSWKRYMNFKTIVWYDLQNVVQINAFIFCLDFLLWKGKTKEKTWNSTNIILPVYFLSICFHMNWNIDSAIEEIRSRMNSWYVVQSFFPLLHHKYSSMQGGK